MSETEQCVDAAEVAVQEAVAPEAVAAAPAPRARPVLWRWVLLGVLLVLGYAIRMAHIGEPPLDFHPARQYHSAIIARALYTLGNPYTPEWKRTLYQRQLKVEGIIEPPVMERAAGLLYRFTGESITVGRVLAVLAWLAGGLFLYLLAARLLAPTLAFVPLLLYLFHPFGIVASRTFQPDAAMVAAMVAALYLLWRAHEAPGWGRLLGAAALAALAGYLKVGALCFLLPAAAALVIARRREEGRPWWSAAADGGLWAYVLVALLPSAIYYINGLFIAGFLRATAQGSFLPHLLLTGNYWQSWVGVLGSTFTYTLLLAGALGLLLARAGRPQALLIGLWAGYLCYGLLFNYAIGTHNYYQLPLLPLLGLGLGVLVAPLWPLVMTAETPARRAVALAGTGVVLLLTLAVVGMQLGALRPGEVPRLARAAMYREIGEKVREVSAALGRPPYVIALTEAYGGPLAYHGDVLVGAWPTAVDFMAARLRGEAAPTARERFLAMVENRPVAFVATDLAELQQQQDIFKILVANYQAIQSDRYFIFVITGPPRASLDEPEERE